MKKISILLFACFAVFNTAHATGAFMAGKDKAASCSGCHGEDGNSIAPIFPRLAGQNQGYLEKQLADFKAHRRKNDSMEAMAQPLSDTDIPNVAAYFSSLKIKNPDPNATQYLDEDEEVEVTPELVMAGRTIYLAGIKSSKVPACSGCHGVEGKGNVPANFPALRKQHAVYVAKTLKDFKAGKRNNDYSSMMRMIAQKMSEEDINAVASYISMMQ